MKTARTVVVALGGNALLPPGERGDIFQQFAHTRESLAPIVAMARDGWHIAVVHGNGPQIGDELYRNEMASAHIPALPLGVLVAGTAGWIGYMIQQSLQNALEKANIEREVVTVITQVCVDPNDPAMKDPTKPIGRDKRLVPSPAPVDIVEKEHIRKLIEHGTIVIAAGGGGIPVYRDPVLKTEGVDAVIDKDRAAALLGELIGAEALLILTNVDGVIEHYGKPDEHLLSELTVSDAEALLRDEDLGKGSMAPKVEAALAFVKRGGKRAHIARLDQGLDALNGKAGTTIR
ncbi:MAG TPA: carbamate kinase [Longimicrobiales bacterium]|nr:carbamate kinase [Longimicrobiales bacterium]